MNLYCNRCARERCLPEGDFAGPDHNEFIRRWVRRVVCAGCGRCKVDWRGERVERATADLYCNRCARERGWAEGDFELRDGLSDPRVCDHREVTCAGCGPCLVDWQGDKADLRAAIRYDSMGEKH